LEINTAVIHFFFFDLEDGCMANIIQLFTVGFEAFQNSALSWFDLGTKSLFIGCARLADVRIELDIFMLLEQLVPKLLAARLRHTMLRSDMVSQA
jgi:hypothetical protein